jgi:hypothetical protein
MKKTQGQIEEMDAAAKGLFAAKPADRPALLKAAQSAASKLQLSASQKDYVEYYVKSMQRVAEKGAEYIDKVGLVGWFNVLMVGVGWGEGV